jgi:prepilin-type N-terminal cleavage/methylation domain-containing protein
MSTRRRHTVHPHGLTILELMIVIAIVGLTMFVMSSAVRKFTKANLAEDAREVSGYLRRASQLAIENGEQHRVVFDLDTGNYLVEVCQGQATLSRNEELRKDEEKQKRELERGQEKLKDLPADTLAVGDPDEAVKRAAAISGHHIADRECSPVTKGSSGRKAITKEDLARQKNEWLRQLRADQQIKFKEIWVQHKDESTTKGQVAIYFFPNGSSEKAVIELTDGDATKTVMVHGLTGRIQQVSGELDDVDTHMLRNALGERDKQRENQ